MKKLFKSYIKIDVSSQDEPIFLTYNKKVSEKIIASFKLRGVYVGHEILVPASDYSIKKIVTYNQENE